MTIVFAATLVTLLAFFALSTFLAISYYYAPVVISLLGLLYLFSIRGFYNQRAKSLINMAKDIENVRPLDTEEEKLFLSSACLVLPRFYLGAQMPANGLSLLTLMNIVFLPMALYFAHYTAAAISAVVLVLLLRVFGFFSRNEIYNMRQSCLAYFFATGRHSFSDLDMQHAATLYVNVLDFAKSITMHSRRLQSANSESQQ